jgi:hypothetical protein
MAIVRLDEHECRYMEGHGSGLCDCVITDFA